MNLKYLLGFVLLLFVSQMAFGQVRSSSRHCFKGAKVTIKGGDTTLVQAKNRLRGANVVRFSTRPLVARFGYVVTDTNHVAKTVTRSNFIDVNKLDPGVHYVYSFSYIGRITGKPGVNIMEKELASYCSQLSDNYVRVEIIE